MARRSARLSKSNQAQTPRSSTKAADSPQLGSVLESEEFQDALEHPSIDSVIQSHETLIDSHLQQLDSLTTPKTEPRPSRGEMHPKTIHKTTAEPDSGFKLGFADLNTDKGSGSILQNTPSRSQENHGRTLPSQHFQFTFGAESHLSDEAKKLMNQVREDAARIKSQMAAEKNAADERDIHADGLLESINASGRKIAKPKARAGRFSDIHMAQFKKMDSIANHASSFRAKPGFIRPTTQSLKRSGSKAGLDVPDRPKTAGKGTPGRMPPPFSGPAASISPPKPVSAIPDRLENPRPVKRARRHETSDVSTSRPAEFVPALQTSARAQPSRTFVSPTKASIARSGSAVAINTQTSSMIPRPGTSRGAPLTPKPKHRFSAATVSRFTSKLLEARQQSQALPVAQSAARVKPLPPLPTEASLGGGAGILAQTAPTAPTTPSSESTPKPKAFASKLPTFSGLRSILRSTHKTSSASRSARPKGCTMDSVIQESAKKVDFTPSVKSRYAVKLAASSPSPAKMHRNNGRRSETNTVTPYDPAAYLLDEEGDETWEEASSPIEYPILPSEVAQPPARPTIATLFHIPSSKVPRDSQQAKSIFTNLHPVTAESPPTLASTSPAISQAGTAKPVDRVTKSPSSLSARLSSSTIRHVRTSGASDFVRHLDTTSEPSASHGPPAKKRGYVPTSDEKGGWNDVEKENRRRTMVCSLPGSWNDTLLDDSADADDEGKNRAGKRARITMDFKPQATTKLEDAVKSPVKKSAAREQAAKNARARKSKGQSLGGMTMSRLNALARPKSRG